VSRLQLFVVVAPGLESLAAAELGELGIPASRVRTRHGGLDVQATTRQLYAVHRWCRIPTRVLLRVATGTARRWDELQDLVRSVTWDAFVEPGEPVELHVTSRGSALYHEGAIAERVLVALARPTATERADGAAVAQAVHVRLDHDRVVLSVDASGDLLHRRGWRVASHRSPLRTTLAAAMVRASGWDGTVPLIDPMCGSGTIPIEAALVRSGQPIERDFAFARWPSFEPGTWASVRGAGRPDLLRAPVLAADRDAGAVASCREHVEATGLADRVTVEQAPLTAQHWPDRPGVVIVNPPYGRRVGGRDLRDLYASLGKRVTDGGHRLVLLANDPRLVAATGVDVREAFATSNGGIEVRCHLGV
jgi:putative N6-adenine-specific DNA methylase